MAAVTVGGGYDSGNGGDGGGGSGEMLMKEAVIVEMVSVSHGENR